MRDLLIVDPTLKSYQGHSWNYDRAVYEAAHACFQNVKLFADVRFASEAADIPVAPVFNRIDLDRLKTLTNWVFGVLRPRATPSLAGEAHATVVPGTPSFLLNIAKWLRTWDFDRTLGRVVSKEGGDTSLHLLVQHAFISELITADRWLHRGSRVCFHVVLRYAPELVNVGFLPDAEFAALLGRIADPVFGNTRLYTDSERLSAQYRALSGRPVRTLPIPVPAALSLNERQGGPVSDITLAFLGSPRVDKGFDELPDLIGRLPGRIGNRRVKALVQVARSNPDQRVRTAIRRLQSLGNRAPEVELLDSPAPREIYYQWFARATMVVLPYLARKYEASTSGILVEAILSGVPVVVRGNSWMSDQVTEAWQRDALKIGEIFLGSDQVPACIERVARDANRYRADTMEYRKIFRGFHSPEMLVRILAGEMP